MPGYNIPDVVVVGCGGGGAVLAKELADAGAGVVVLEAGPWFDPAADFAGTEWEMLGGIDSLFRWGPLDRSLPPWPHSADGISLRGRVAGVGGTTLAYGGNSPRAYPAAVELEWPLSYGEMIPYYEKVEATLPVVVPDVIAPKDERFVDGCAAIGLAHQATPDVTRPGWRIQPNAILPVASRAKPNAGCTQCGQCLTGCRHPLDAPAHLTAKRGTNAGYAPAAVATDRCEIRTGCFATRVLVDDRMRVRAVRYRDAKGKVYEQDAHVVVLAAGAIESPRLWLASGLPAIGGAGRGLATQWIEYVAGVFPREVSPDLGQTSMARADFPGYGFLESRGGGPLWLASSAYSGRWGRAPGAPFASRGRLAGHALKRRMEAYRHTVVVACGVDDERRAQSLVTLDGGVADEHNPAPLVRYRPTPATTERRDWLAAKAGQILLAAGAIPESIHRADAPPTVAHALGTLRMGRSSSDSVLDDACEARHVKGLFVADASALPNSLGGANPALTVQALATRTAVKIRERYLG